MYLHPSESGWEGEVPSHPRDLNSSLPLQSQSGRGSTSAKTKPQITFILHLSKPKAEHNT